MARGFVQPAARRDLVAHYVYLAENADAATAVRFLVRAAASIDELIDNPEIGAALVLRRAELAGIRRWRVRDFDRYLIFYQPRASGGVTIVRVLHAAQDWWGMLGLSE
jgi:toxin ParE1/3/4